MMLIKTTTIQDLIFAGLTLIVLSLPLTAANINSYFIILTLLLILFQKNAFSRLAESLKNKYVILFTSLFMLMLIGMTYTENVSDGIYTITKKFSLLIFPIFIAAIPKLSKSRLNFLFKIFLISCFIGALICLISNILKLAEAGRPVSHLFYYDIYYNFTSPINAHSVYFSLYLVFALIIIAYLFPKQNNLTKLILLLLGVFFVFIILVMASRMQIIILIAICIVSIFLYVKKKVYALLFVIMISLMMWFSITSMRFTYYQFYKLFETEMKISTSYQKSGHKRLSRWMVTLNDVKSHLLTGVGTGDTQDFLNNAYSKHKMEVALQYQYNTHNEYLNYLVTFGIIGLLILLLNLFLPLYFAISKNVILYTLFITIIAMSFFSENILGRQNGVVFYAFFNSLLAFHMLNLGKPATHAACSN